jgi:hypothetical protein
MFQHYRDLSSDQKVSWMFKGTVQPFKGMVEKLLILYCLAILKFNFKGSIKSFIIFSRIY